MITRKEIDELKEVISQSSKILLLTHDFPDGDAVGSLYAFCGYLNSIGKEYRFCFSNLDEELWNELLPGFADKRISEDQITNFGAELLIVLDSSNPDRVGALKSYFHSFQHIVNIDHHGDNNSFGSLNIVKEASATGEVVYDLFKKLAWKPDALTAKATLTAIIADTGRFQFVNTHPALFLIISEIMAICGMETYFKIVQGLYEEVSLNKLQLLAEAIRNVEFFGNGVAFSYIDDNAGLTEGLIDQIRAIKGVKVAVLVRRVEDKVKISFRSKDKTLSVRELAGKFGGGGHPGASGATLPLTDIELQIAEIRKTVKEYAESF
jgi:phosphoesterase RecJ-like protein